RDRGHRARRDRLRETEALERAARRDPGPGDGRAARPPVGLENVAVEPERALAEGLEVADRAQGAADETLDLDGPPVGPAAGHGALIPLSCRRREHRVLGSHPAASASVQPARNPLLDRCGAEDECLALSVE